MLEMSRVRKENFVKVTKEKAEFRSVGRTIYQNIRDLCKEAHVTVESLEINLQIAKNSISRWGRGEVVPRLDVLMVIAKDFGVTLDYLVTEHK